MPIRPNDRCCYFSQPTVDMNLLPGSLSMCAGDFVEVYSTPENEGAFDAVVTCFFIDTAHNIARRARCPVSRSTEMPSRQAPSRPAAQSRRDARSECATGLGVSGGGSEFGALPNF